MPPYKIPNKARTDIAPAQTKITVLTTEPTGLKRFSPKTPSKYQFLAVASTFLPIDP